MTAFGNSAGIVFPKEVLAQLKVAKGDLLYITEAPGGVQLSPYDESFAQEMEAGRRVMKKHRDVLRKLAG